MLKYKTEKWWHYWYGFGARIDAVMHWLRGHDVEWYANPYYNAEDEGECKGDIICRNCPDTAEGGTLAIWCRWRYFRQPK